MEVPSFLQHIQLQFRGISNFRPWATPCCPIKLSGVLTWKITRNPGSSIYWSDAAQFWGFKNGFATASGSWSRSWVLLGQNTQGLQFLQGMKAMELLPGEMLIIKALLVALGPAPPQVCQEYTPGDETCSGILGMEGKIWCYTFTGWQRLLTRRTRIQCTCKAPLDRKSVV